MRRRCIFFLCIQKQKHVYSNFFPKFLDASCSLAPIVRSNHFSYLKLHSLLFYRKPSEWQVPHFSSTISKNFFCVFSTIIHDVPKCLCPLVSCVYEWSQWTKCLFAGKNIERHTCGSALKKIEKKTNNSPEKTSQLWCSMCMSQGMNQQGVKKYQHSKTKDNLERQMPTIYECYPRCESTTAKQIPSMGCTATS